jgi:hypothetical protein
MEINFICVCTGSYDIRYARVLINRIKSLSKIEFKYYCITDRPNEILDLAIPLQPNPFSTGWWNKMELHGPNMPDGWNLYLDLDIVIFQNFDEEIMWSISKQPEMACVSDAVNWMGCKFNSSLMIYKSFSHLEIYKKYELEKDNLQNYSGGDQVWIGPQLKNIIYIDETYPNLKKSLKFQLAKIEKSTGKLLVPNQLSDEIKMMDCSGKPKPHELEMLPYVKQNWHDFLIV